MSKETTAFLKAVALHLNVVFHLAAPSIKIEIGRLCDDLIENDPDGTYASLIHGDLLGELGLEHPEQRLQEILLTIKNNLQVTVVPPMVVGDKIRGGINIGILVAGFQDLISLSSSSYTSQPSGENIPWLEWLIGGGHQILVLNYQIIKNLNAKQKQI